MTRLVDVDGHQWVSMIGKAPDRPWRLLAIERVTRNGGWILAYINKLADRVRSDESSARTVK